MQNKGKYYRVLFESKKVKDDALPMFVEEFLDEQKIKMSPKGISMLCESVGADLSRLNGELNKLITALPEGQKEITPEFIEEHIGFSISRMVSDVSSAMMFLADITIECEAISPTEFEYPDFR